MCCLVLGGQFTAGLWSLFTGNCCLLGWKQLYGSTERRYKWWSGQLNNELKFTTKLHSINRSCFYIAIGSILMKNIHYSCFKMKRGNILRWLSFGWISTHLPVSVFVVCCNTLCWEVFPALSVVTTAVTHFSVKRPCNQQKTITASLRHSKHSIPASAHFLITY